MNYTKRVKELNQTFKEILDKCPELTFIGNPILRQRTDDVILEEGIKIASKLKKTLETYRDITGFGRGLAAPQIGESKSVFVTYVGEKFNTYINPRIIGNSSKLNYYRENCLSCGFVSVDVRRPISIIIEYTNEEGKLQKENLDSFSARLIQHEYDHLIGIVNVDKAEQNSIDFMINDPLKEILRDDK
ncbi:MAG: peptide deformylase [Minisyncoccia bacterium]